MLKKQVMRKENEGMKIYARGREKTLEKGLEIEKRTTQNKKRSNNETKKKEVRKTSGVKKKI